MKLNGNYLTTPLFVISLGVLILNDWFFKEAFHNELTGKLSDLAGVIVLLLFLNFLQDKYKLLNACIVVLFFIYWKSPLSSSLILVFNDLGLYRINRVVDYWDLLVLFVIPVVYKIEFKPKVLSKKQPIIIGLSISTVFALCSTSQIKRPSKLDYGNIIYEFTSELSPTEFISNLHKHEHLKLAQQDSILINWNPVNSFLFIHDSIHPVQLDSCRLVLTPKNKRRLNVQIISIGVSSTKDLNALNLVAILNRYKIKGRITSRDVFIKSMP